MLNFDHEPGVTESDLPRWEDYTAFHPFMKGVFSQWHTTPFSIGDYSFVTAEQWMMFSKASLFRDHRKAEEILATDDPSEQKLLGTLVESFDQEVWDRWRIEIVYTGNKAKFSQNPGAARRLANTSGGMLVEANVRDWIWGVGRAIDDPRASRPREWRGTNLLGRILTLVRDELEK